MFEFLRLSPSYERARQAASAGLTEAQSADLPADFQQVLATYDLLGDVQETLFRQWWLKRGLRAFGNPMSKPRSHGICLLPAAVSVEAEDVLGDLDRYLSEVRSEQGLPPTLLLALPLGERKGEILKQVSRILDKHSAAEKANLLQPNLVLLGQRLRAKTLFNGLRLLWFRAAKPRWEYWRLGAQARLSKTYSGALDPLAPKRTSDHRERVDRDLMTKITYRALTKYERIAENAARGRFPCEDPVQMLPFDYAAIARLIRRKNSWEAATKAKLMKAHMAQKSPAST